METVPRELKAHYSFTSLFRPLFLRPLTNRHPFYKQRQRKLPRQIVLFGSFAFVACFSLDVCKNIACFCACVWDATVTNPHQVDEKLFQDLFLFFIRHLVGFRPHHERPKEHFLDRPTDSPSKRYDTSCNTNVEQRNVASALHRPLRQRFHSLKGGLRAMFCNSYNFC